MYVSMSVDTVSNSNLGLVLATHVGSAQVDDGRGRLLSLIWERDPCFLLCTRVFMWKSLLAIL